MSMSQNLNIQRSILKTFHKLKISNMNAFESMVFTFAILLGVWMIADILENVVEQDGNEDVKINNRETMDHMAKMQFFKENSIDRGFGKYYYH